MPPLMRMRTVAVVSQPNYGGPDLVIPFLTVYWSVLMRLNLMEMKLLHAIDYLDVDDRLSLDLWAMGHGQAAIFAYKINLLMLVDR